MNLIHSLAISIGTSLLFGLPGIGKETELPQVFTPLPLGEVKPAGWLRNWCQDAASGITGHSDDLDPLFARGWMDGRIKATGKGAQSGDKMVGYALEQAGYWVDGAVRLAHLVDDEALLAKCRVRFETVIKRVEAGKPPIPSTKLWEAGEKWGHWPMAVMGRAMLAEYSFSKDPRYLRTLENIYANYPQYNKNGRFSLINHQGRQLSNIEVMYEAYRLGGSRRLRDDATTVLEQQAGEINSRLGWHRHGIGCGKTHSNFNSVPFGHAVTLNESAKLPAIGYLYTGRREWLDFSESSFADMEQNEMMPYGLTSAHEHLGGIGPFSCTELCNAIDYSWSSIWMLRITGNATYGDRVERAMFNAAPSGISPDFQTHQYFLSPNRIDESHPGRYRVGGDSSFAPKQFPLCCTGNLSRLLPNFVMHLWMASQDGGLAATLYGPSETKTHVAGEAVSLAPRTDYPFRNDVRIAFTTANPVRFPLHLRVPEWCGAPELTINGNVRKTTVKHGFIRIERTWSTGDEVHLSFPNQPRFLTGKTADGAPFASVCHGPLLFALRIPTLGDDPNRPQPGTPWQFALSPDAPVQVEHLPMPQRWSWKETPVQLRLNAGMAEFGEDFSLPGEPLATGGQPIPITLVPIGSTAFRVSMFGVLNNKGTDPQK